MMKPLKQRYLHDPAHGVYGDCHRAAVASMLEMELDDVPHFGEGGVSTHEFNRRVDAFLLSQGIVQINIVYNSPLPDVLKCMKAYNPGVYYLLGGESKSRVDHTVVCFEDQIVHDPSLNDSGIIGPCQHDGLYWVTFFGSSKMMAKGRAVHVEAAAG